MDLSREHIIETYLTLLRSICAKDEYIKAVSMLNSMSDEELVNMAMRHYQKYLKAEHKPTMRDYFKAVSEIRKSKGLGIDNSADFVITADDSVSQQNQATKSWFRLMQETKPTDYIQIGPEEDKALMALWGYTPDKGTPSDLFFAGHVPLLDCQITSEEDGGYYTFRVHIYEDFADRIAASGDNDTTEVGLLEINILNQVKTITPLLVAPGLDTMAVSSGAINHEIVNKPNWSIGEWAESLCSYLNTWYGVQIALLHPNVRDVFSNPTLRKVKEGKRGDRQHKRVTKYVKKHVLNAKEIEDASKCRGKYERKTLVWYVIGHWRCYKDGHKVFIQPYWKGVLRKLKMDLDNRERLLALG